MGIFDSLIEYYSIPDAIDYLSSNLSEEVTEQDLSRLITERKLRVWVRFKSNVYARISDCDLAIGNDHPLPLHPNLYYCESTEEIERLEVYLVRASRVLELGMTHTDLIAIEDKIKGEIEWRGNITYPITLVDPASQKIYYLCQRGTNHWGADEDWFEPTTSLYSACELLIKLDELKRLVDLVKFNKADFTDWDDLYIEPPKTQLKPTENNAPAFQSLSAPPPGQMPSEITLVKINMALIRLLATNGGNCFRLNGKPNLTGIAKALLENEREHRALNDQAEDPKGFKKGTISAMNVSDRHYSDIDLEAVLVDFLEHINNEDKP